MDPEEITRKLQKIIKMNRDEAMLKSVYLNPLYVKELARKVPELKELGFKLSQTETETNQGSLVSATIMAPTGSRLRLGSILLDGKDLRIQRTLQTIDDLSEFILQESAGSPT